MPYFDCVACHGDPVTGILTGNNFGVGWAPSCYQCHDDLWNDPGNLSPTVDAGGPYTGTVGRRRLHLQRRETLIRAVLARDGNLTRVFADLTVSWSI